MNVNMINGTQNKTQNNMSIISESYRKKLMSLAGLNSNTLEESSRLDFLQKDFKERVERKYDKFLKFFSRGNWNPESESDNFIKNILFKDKLVLTKDNKVVPKEMLVNSIMDNIFPQLENSDPTENKQYLNWIINIFMSGNLPVEDIYKLNEALVLFSKNKEKIPVEQRNINSLTDLSSLLDLVSKYSKEEDMSTTEKEKIIKLEGAEQVYDSPNWKVIIPKTQEAACLYGKSTKWCTAAVENSNRFHYYDKQGPLYILIDKRIKNDRDHYKKLQFHFKTNQFMDTMDRQINLTDFFIQNTELKDFFKKIGEINSTFEIEHMLVSKEEGIKLLKTTKNKIDLINKKGFDFFKKFFITIGASKTLIDALLTDQELIKYLFESNKFDDLIESYKELKIQSSGLNVIKSLPWLEAWLMSPQTKPDIIEIFIFSICEEFGEEGKAFAMQLLERGGIIWNALLQPNHIKISHYFNMLSSRKSFGNSGIIKAKKLLNDKSVIDELTSKKVSKQTIEMLKKFYKFYKDISENRQAHIYLKNILS